MNLKDLIQVVSGKLIDDSLDNLSSSDINNINIDSRTIKSGEIFVAIKGNKFDGHKFIQDVIEKGALGCIISDKSYLDKISVDQKESCKMILVEDTTIALGQIAKKIISLFNFPVIAITGSCGKTTTKELLAAILKTKGEVLYSDKSFNNHVGVPLTAIKSLKEKKNYIAAIFEIGTNHPGEIDYLTEIVRPDISILTKVAPVHIGNFESLDDLVFEKQQIFKYLDENSLAIVNLDDFYSFKHKSANTQYFSLENSDAADIYASNIEIDKNQYPGFNLNYKNQSIHLVSPLLGKHNIYNILSASCAAISLNYSLDDIKKGIEENLNQITGRLELKQGIYNSTIIDDSYNANPIAVQASLDILANYSKESKKCFVFADMGELGQDAKFYHQEIGKLINEKEIDYFYAYGDLVKFSIDNYNKLNSKTAVYCSSKEELTLKLKQLLKNEAGVTLLFKGSNSMGLKDVVKNLVSN